jgi:putative ABC transport system substrate-binding protein
MRRREFIGLAGCAAAWPLAARAQQSERMRRIGVLSGASAGDQELRARHTTFIQALAQLGWIDGRNVRVDYRYGEGVTDDIRKNAAELISLAPDVIIVTGAVVEQLLQATRTIPVVFVIVPDPVGTGLVESLSRPGGNATGFMQFEYNLCAKWPELLKEIAPSVTRVAVLRDAASPSGIGQFAVIQSVAPTVGLEAVPINVRNASEFERATAAFARAGGGGMIVTASPLMAFHRDLITALAAAHKLPTVYNSRQFIPGGGLVSYGADFMDQYRRAASYVDRILKGEQPANLPVQAPTKYDLVVNLKTARTLGLTVPLILQQRADEVIE